MALQVKDRPHFLTDSPYPSRCRTPQPHTGWSWTFAAACESVVTIFAADGAASTSSVPSKVRVSAPVCPCRCDCACLVVTTLAPAGCSSSPPCHADPNPFTMCWPCCVVQWVPLTSLSTTCVVRDMCWSFLRSDAVVATVAEHPILVLAGSTVSAVKVNAVLATVAAPVAPATPAAPAPSTSIKKESSRKGPRGPVAAAAPKTPVTVLQVVDVCLSEEVLATAPTMLTKAVVSPDGRAIATTGPGVDGVLVWHRNVDAHGASSFVYSHLVVDDIGEPVIATVDITSSRVVALEWKATVASNVHDESLPPPLLLMGLWSDGQLRLWRESGRHLAFDFALCSSVSVAGPDACYFDGSDLTTSNNFGWSSLPEEELRALPVDGLCLSASWVSYSALKERVRGAWSSGDMSPIRIVVSSVQNAESTTLTLAALSAMAGRGEPARVLAHAIAETTVAAAWPCSGHATGARGTIVDLD